MNSENQIHVTGIQPVGTVVCYLPAMPERGIQYAYVEVVVMSDAEKGKQLIHCKDVEHPMYRIEWLDNRNRESNLGLTDQADAEAVYIGL